MNRIFFTSNTFYGCSECLKKGANSTGLMYVPYRGDRFKNIKEMNKALVDNINKVVRKNDILYHVGNFSTGGMFKLQEFRDNLDCRNIHIVCNIEDGQIMQDRVVMFLDDGVITAKELFNTVKGRKEITIDGRSITMIGGVVRIYNGSEFDSRNPAIDLHKDFRPYSYEELKNSITYFNT